MKWAEFLGHQRQQKWFANAIAHNKLASTFLLVGPSGIGKRTFAKLIAKSLLCTETDPKALDFCNACDTCLQIQCETHPDFLYIKRGQAKNTEKEKSVITMEQLVGSKEARMREGFCYEIRIRPYSSRRRIGVIDDADTLDEETSNSLLKTLEEPPPGAVIFLVGTSEKRQISTIRSRCQIVRFSPLSIQNVEQLILTFKILLWPSPSRPNPMVRSNTQKNFPIKALWIFEIKSKRFSSNDLPISWAFQKPS
jgi:DNA polymerase-3 subunit delta'